MKTFTPSLVLPSKTQENAHFGGAVAVSGSTLLVGAHGEGSAYVFVRAANTTGNIWGQQSKLKPEKSSPRFGMSVALHGDSALVGAEGKATLFQRTGTSWKRVLTLRAASFGASSSFGVGVAIDDQHVVVSSDLDQRVYVFARQGTELIFAQTLDSKPAGRLSLDGERLLAARSGLGANVFRRGPTQWVRETALKPTVAGSTWGDHGAISGVRAIVTSLDGASFIFHRDHAGNWKKERDVDELLEGGNIGLEVAGGVLVGPRALVSQILAPVSLLERKTSGWKKTAEVATPWPIEDLRVRGFGYDGAIALSERYAAIGAVDATFGLAKQGAVFVAEIATPPSSPGEAQPGWAYEYLDRLEARASELQSVGSDPAARLPPGVRAFTYVDEAGKRALFAAVDRIKRRVPVLKTRSIKELLAHPHAVVVLDPIDPTKALNWLQRHAAEIARTRFAPAVLLLDASRQLHRRGRPSGRPRER